MRFRNMVVLVVHLVGICVTLLTTKNQKQDDESEKNGESDADRGKGCRPNRSIIDAAAVDDAVIERLHGPVVACQQNILPPVSFQRRRIRADASLEHLHLAKHKNMTRKRSA